MGLCAPAASRRRREATGAVTAETAVVLPVLVAVAVALTWMLSLAVTQVRVVDAARETARAAARGDGAAAAVARGHRVAPRGAEISVHTSGDSVEAEARASERGPAGLLGFLPAVEVSSHAVNSREQQ